MKVTAIETIRLEQFPNILWVQVESDEGPVGLGETFYGAGAAEAHVHEFIAPYLLGKNPLEIERHAQKMVGYLGYVGSSAEIRGFSAVDMALWDLWGQVTNQPLYQLLGGACRESIRIYNTCAGYRYVQKRPAQGPANFGLPDGKPLGPYEDLEAFLTRADELAESLLEMGITGMKIWPFDFAAEASGGQYISGADLKTGLEPFEKIRKAVGDRIDIMVELHGMWHLPPVKQIAGALEEFDPFWFEDPVKMDHLSSIGIFADSTFVPVATGETLGARGQYRTLLEMQAVGLCILDLSWCGGITEARKVAAMADTWHVPVAFHDCSGPVVLAASSHMAMHVPNIYIQEMVRAFYYGWYGDMVTQLPPIENGTIRPPEGPGLGLALTPDVKKRADARTRRTTLD
ncbi:MAG: dehydratase [Rhodospirillaceae bacterium]|nr:dehydratase [Rhodospirillaceae bacterium]